MSPNATKNSQQLLAEDHEALHTLLSALLTAIDQGDSATVFARLDLFWALLAMHIRAEHLCLFPALLKAIDNNLSDQESSVDAMEARQSIDRLRSDHNFFMHELAEAVKIIRESTVIGDRRSETETVDQVRQIVVAVSDRLESHNQLEEQFVYSLPQKILSIDEQSELAATIRRELENLPLRFAKSREMTKDSELNDRG